MSRIVLMCKWQPAVVCTFLRLGCEVVLVIDAFDVASGHPDQALLDACSVVYEVDSFDALEQLAAIAGDLMSAGVHPDLVFAHTEFSQLGGGYIELLLGGRYAAQRHAALRDKRVMKTAVARAGVAVPAWCSVAGPGDDAGISAAMSRLAFPVVVKPAFGMGTMSTFRVERAEHLASRLAEMHYESSLRSRQLIVEEFVVGRELHVDALWIDGEPRYFLVSAYLEPRLDIAHGVGVAHRLDGSCVLPVHDARELYKLVGAQHRLVNDALHISDGVTHTEFFHRPDGSLVFSETGARLGGGWIPQVLDHHLGGDVWSLVAEALVTGQTPEWPPPSTYLGGLNLRPVAPGRITRMPNAAAVRATPGVRAYEALVDLGNESAQRAAAEWTAIVVLEADTEAHYMEVAADVVASHPVVTMPFL